MKMIAPLPNDTLEVLRSNEREVDNLHLLFYRYVWAWHKEHDGSWALKDGVPNKLDRRKSDFLNRIAGLTGEQTSQQASTCLKHHHKRFVAYLEALDDDDHWYVEQDLVLETDWRFIAGLGYKGALEVGITLHHLYGFPYLPGPSVKGVARAWAERVLLPDNKTTEREIHDVFGSPEKDETRAKDFRLGGVRFFDALPTQFPKLDVDVMTPHYGDYYENSQKPPGDWYDPVPVPFLTVAPGTPFHFGLAAREEALLKKATAWLKAGLKDLGAGGKTAAGYGYFLTRSDREAEQEKLERLAKSLREEEKKAAFTPPNKSTSVGKNSTKVPAQVIGYRGSVLVVRLHVADYEQQTFELGKYAGFQKDEWVEVNVAGTNKKGRVTQVQYAGRLSPSQ